MKAGDPVIGRRGVSQVYLGCALPHCQLTEGKCDVMVDLLQAYDSYGRGTGLGLTMAAVAVEVLLLATAVSTAAAAAQPLAYAVTA